ncbi:hypothetical protein [Mammaliicoccus sp. JADD-157]|uniref:hypothetical protein n=1 Tax=Mammaliicoccus sp. JADD-157 TaxID=3404818 RepID=UPI003BB64830
MKITVDLNADTIARLNEYADHNNRPLDDVVDDILESYLTKPAAELEMILNDPDLHSEYKSFQSTLNTYMIEEINTLESMSKTESGLPTDYAMAKVFERLTSKHLFKSYLNVDLFTTFMKNKI